MQSRYLQFDKKDSKKVLSSGVSQRKAEKVRGAAWTCIRETWGEPTLLGLRGDCGVLLLGSLDYTLR